MTVRDIISLLQLGFAGFAAFIALLCFRLMRKEISRKTRNLKIFDQIRVFIRYTLVLALIVILGTTIERGLDYYFMRDTRQTITLSKQAQDCREALLGLQGREGRYSDKDDLRQAYQLTYQACFRVMKSIEELEAK
jgi:hypothetical protein